MTIHAANRINRLLSKYKESRYLEVGVFRGETFFNVRAQSKVAVDPNFRFDVPENAPEARFFQMTSDDYFLKEACNEVFDVIFLDGLHTFEQTFRDFCNAVTHTHERSVIIIDDTIPSDPYSAIRDQMLAIKRRREHGGTSGAWHGDTFKTVLAIHDFFPQFSYATVTDLGNPQTIVWRQKRAFKPLHQRMEEIGLSDYFSFLDKKGTFNPKSEDEVEAIVDAALFPDHQHTSLSSINRETA